MHSKHDLTKQVYEVITKEKMIKAGDLVLVAFSGGPDSLVLLHILLRLKERLNIELAAAHLDHGLRGAESQAEAQWVEQFCKTWQIPCYMGYWNGLQDKASGLSPEEAARKARLKFLQSQQKIIGATVIAQGHHGDDQAETMIIRLLNGAGLRGLGGIKPVRHPYIRPLIYCSRQQILNYCQDFELKPRFDSSNLSNIYLRNQIRHQLMPLLKTYNPRLIETLGRTAEVLQSEDDFLDKLASKALQDVKSEEERNPDSKTFSLSLEKLNSLDLVLARRVVRLWVEAELDYASVQRVIDLASDGKVGGVAELVGPLLVKRGYKELQLLPKKVLQEKQEQSQKIWPMVENVWVVIGLNQLKVTCRIGPCQELKQKDALQYCIPWDTKLGLPIWRRRKAGDWIQFSYGRKKLNRWLIDQKIPAQKRDELVCLVWQQQILWVPGLFKGIGPLKKNQTKDYLWVCCQKI